MAREGLRTLVVAKRTLTEEQYQDFEVSCRQSLPLKALPPYENFFLMKANLPVFLKFENMDYLPLSS